MFRKVLSRYLHYYVADSEAETYVKKLVEAVLKMMSDSNPTVQESGVSLAPPIR
jgi:hypothetical protein